MEHAQFADRLDGVSHVESEISKCFETEVLLVGSPSRFLPYIQLYELEALLFAGPHEMAAVFEQPELAVAVEDVVAACGGCENINHGELTHPAKRIESIFGRKYVKCDNDQAHAPNIANRIGMERMRAACPRFNAWVVSLLERADL